jgi:hypothetical protein
MATLSAALRSHMHTPHTLSYEMALFVGKPAATRDEMFAAIRDYAKDQKLYRPDNFTIKPDILLASLLGSRTSIPIAEIHQRTARHLLGALTPS